MGCDRGVPGPTASCLASLTYKALETNSAWDGSINVCPWLLSNLNYLGRVTGENSSALSQK